MSNVDTNLNPEGSLDNLAAEAAGYQSQHATSSWMRPIEVASAILMVAIVVLLLIAVATRYALTTQVVWIEEVVATAFVWLAMMGAAIAMYRHEHLRLTLFVNMLPERGRSFVQTFSLVCMSVFLIAMLGPAYDYAIEEWVIRTPTLEIPSTFRVSAMLFGVVMMLVIIVVHAVRKSQWKDLLLAAVLVGTAASVFWWFSPQFQQLSAVTNIGIFLAILVTFFLFAGVPIGFCFGLGTLSYLAFTSHMPLMVIISRMDEGMSSIVLVSIPVFVLLGCILDATGMGKAIVDVLASLVGHIKAGMSYVLLGSLFVVSGISGSKTSDMATVAPALFPEMERRGHKKAGMVALLATGAAMADTVPPSIVLIVLGSVAGVSIAGLFQSGFVVAMVLLIALMALARWYARDEDMRGVTRPSLNVVVKLIVVAAPALTLPFIIRSTVAGGFATATEVSSIAVLYAMIIGHFLYGGIGARKIYGMLVETATLSGAILLILGTASGMSWAVTQSGVIQNMTNFLISLPGGVVAFIVVSTIIFVVLGCLLEGLPAILLLAPIMFPIARKLGIHDIHYSMIAVCAMNIGYMTPPIGIGLYIACRIGDASPDEVTKAIWPYLIALFVGVAIIAAVPWISTVALD
jgi:tripartite ATP-independent transporter DctM subunit